MLVPGGTVTEGLCSYALPDRLSPHKLAHSDHTSSWHLISASARHQRNFTARLTVYIQRDRLCESAVNDKRNAKTSPCGTDPRS